MDTKLLRRVTTEFNKYRVPECKAKVLSNKDKALIVEFSGTTAHFSCCFDEYFIDYGYYLKDLARCDFKINKLRRPREEKFVVIYKPEG